VSFPIAIAPVPLTIFIPGLPAKDPSNAASTSFPILKFILLNTRSTIQSIFFATFFTSPYPGIPKNTLPISFLSIFDFSIILFKASFSIFSNPSNPTCS
jgi:hypothetical protein